MVVKKLLNFFSNFFFHLDLSKAIVDFKIFHFPEKRQKTENSKHKIGLVSRKMKMENWKSLTLLFSNHDDPWLLQKKKTIVNK